MGLVAGNTRDVATNVISPGNANYRKSPSSRNGFDHQFPLEKSSPIPTPEGRVHGGILMAMLSETPSVSSRTIGHANGVPSREYEPRDVPHKWI